MTIVSRVLEDGASTGDDYQPASVAFLLLTKENENISLPLVAAKTLTGRHRSLDPYW